MERKSAERRAEARLILTYLHPQSEEIHAGIAANDCDEVAQVPHTEKSGYHYNHE